MVTILMMSGKMATQNLPKIKVIWNKGYHGRSKILSPDCIVDVVMWSKFGNSSISLREVITTSIS